MQQNGTCEVCKHFKDMRSPINPLQSWCKHHKKTTVADSICKQIDIDWKALIAKMK